MKILIIDNYDSFTFNLYQLIGELIGRNDILEVVKNDELTFEEIRSKNFDRIIISPGPGTPEDDSYFGICKRVILELGKTTPILGICLGMQGIAYSFAGNIVKAPLPFHGKKSSIKHRGIGAFRQLPQNIRVMRYHSLCVDEETLPKVLEVTANTSGVIMGLRHKTLPIEGVQFHPESFATEYGAEMISNFLFDKK